MPSTPARRGAQRYRSQPRRVCRTPTICRSKAANPAPRSGPEPPQGPARRPDRRSNPPETRSYPDGQCRAGAHPRWRRHVGNACELPLETGSVSGYRADKVLHALDDPARAVAEARRVLAPGGGAVLLGQDWDTIVIDSDDPQTTRRLIHAKADSLPSPRVARRYLNLLLNAGFTDPVVEVHTGVFTDDTALAILHRHRRGQLARRASRPYADEPDLRRGADVPRRRAEIAPSPDRDALSGAISLRTMEIAPDPGRQREPLPSPRPWG